MRIVSQTVKKILLIASHRTGRSPNQRFRFEHYFTYWKSKGYEVSVSSFITANDDQYLYQKGHFFRKLFIAIKSVLHRVADLTRIRRYDLIIVVRESLLTRSTFFEKFARKSGIPMIYDFDDAIWLPNVSESNRKLTWLKKPSKTRNSISYASLVIAGNSFLKEYALQFNSNVIVIPTTLDTIYYKPLENKPCNDFVTIGWSGSPTTIGHFRIAEKALEIIKEKYGNKVRFVVMGAPQYQNDKLSLQGIGWSPDMEIPILNTFDIGLMPLPDDEWSKGKCGFKALLYMSLGITPVLSPVGVNQEIVTEGLNGFFASNTEEWVEKLSLLIEDHELRKQCGDTARKYLEEKYSVQAWQEKYIYYFDFLTNKYANK